MIIHHIREMCCLLGRAGFVWALLSPLDPMMAELAVMSLYSAMTGLESV
jgi:hypothetical protein